jgi:AraC family transcriptional regulator, positive regulator of tynA and feaB
VYRDAAEISRLDNDALVINFVTEAQLYSEQDGRSSVLGPGDSAVSDAARPYFLRFDKPLGCVSVKVFKSALAHRVSGLERITASSMARGSTLNPLVYDYLTHMIKTRFVALGLKLSPRYINKLFEAENTSLGRYIWQRRLERCAATLRDRAFAPRSVSSIALANGFNDLSHFSRAFRLNFGESPTRFRQAALRS